MRPVYRRVPSRFRGRPGRGRPGHAAPATTQGMWCRGAGVPALKRLASLHGKRRSEGCADVIGHPGDGNG